MPAIVPKVFAHERAAPDRGVHVARLGQHPPRLRERIDRERVPRGEHLVVGRRVDAALADIEQAPARRLHLRRQLVGVAAELSGDDAHRQRPP